MTDPDFDAAKKSYDRDGFVVLPNYLTQVELDALRDHAIPLAKQLLKEEDDPGQYRNLLKSLHRHDEWFARHLADGRHVPLLNHLLGDKVLGASAAWFDRPEGETLGLGPHVDALGNNQLPDAGLTIWFALDAVDVSNGCLHYLRGSHKVNYPKVIPIPGIDLESKDAFAAELNPGDAVVHNALTVHWSSGNATNRPRRAVSYFYFSASAHAALQQKKEA